MIAFPVDHVMLGDLPAYRRFLPLPPVLPSPKPSASPSARAFARQSLPPGITPRYSDVERLGRLTPLVRSPARRRTLRRIWRAFMAAWDALADPMGPDDEEVMVLVLSLFAQLRQHGVRFDPAFVADMDAMARQAGGVIDGDMSDLSEF